MSNETRSETEYAEQGLRYRRGLQEYQRLDPSAQYLCQPRFPTYPDDLLMKTDHLRQKLKTDEKPEKVRYGFECM